MLMDDSGSGLVILIKYVELGCKIWKDVFQSNCKSSEFNIASSVCVSLSFMLVIFDGNSKRHLYWFFLVFCNYGCSWFICFGDNSIILYFFQILFQPLVHLWYRKNWIFYYSFVFYCRWNTTWVKAFFKEISLFKVD